MKMSLDTAQRLIGCYLGGNPPATAAEVRASYAMRVRECHPDTGSGPAYATMAELQQAKKTLLEALTGQNSACVLCKGRGRVPHRIGTRQCAACGGTGETKYETGSHTNITA